ncbi:hypothetical protein PYCC9005_002447 [Savitreella phatthalungensis]
MAAGLLDLPAEVIQCLLAYLPGSSFQALACSCRRFNQFLRDDWLWQSAILQAESSFSVSLFSKATWDSPAPYSSWRELFFKVYRKHGWLIGTWHGNNEWTGQLLEVVYNPATGFIECYALQPYAYFSFPVRFSRDRSVIWRDFEPILQAREDVVFRMGQGSDRLRQSGDCVLGRVVGFDSERIEACTRELESQGTLFTGDDDEDRDLLPTWPTQHMPSPERIILARTDEQMHRPREWESWSDHLFALSRPVFNPMSLIAPTALPVPLPKHTILYSRLPATDSAHVPANFRQWSGLFMGDYSSHGPELLYLYYPTSTSLRAIKVTGDPNVPRGEISWRVDDLTSVKRICQEDEWPGARAFDGLGHISPHGFTDPSWIEAEVIFYEWPQREGRQRQRITSTAAAAASAFGANFATRFDGSDPLRPPALSRTDTSRERSAGSRPGDDSSQNPSGELSEPASIENDPARFGVAIWWKEMMHISQFHKVDHIRQTWAHEATS